MPYRPDAPAAATVLEQGGTDSHRRGRAIRPPRLPGRDHTVALQEVAAVIQGGAPPEWFRESIDAGYRQLGNRSFMHWVGEMHAAGHGGQAQADAMQGRQDPAGSAPLQCMPKKRKPKEAAGKVTPEGQTEATPETGAPEVPGAIADTPPGAVAQAVAEAAATRPAAAGNGDGRGGGEEKEEEIPGAGGAEYLAGGRGGGIQGLP